MRLEKDSKIETIEREGTLLHKGLADGRKRRKRKKIAAEKVWENESVFKVSGENELFFISIFLIIV
jgi:hypothetical protein